MKNVNTGVGLGDGVIQRSQAVYETVSGSTDPTVCACWWILADSGRFLAKIAWGLGLKMFLFFMKK